MQLYGEIGRPADSQSAIANRLNLANCNVVGINLRILESRQVRSNHAAQRATTYNTDFHGHRKSCEETCLTGPALRFGRRDSSIPEGVLSTSRTRLTPLWTEVI